MELDTIGKNIRKFRQQTKLRQEDLAEKTGLSPNYVGMVERGEKIPALETFIKIINALDVSADMVLADLINNGYTIKNSMWNESMSQIDKKTQDMIYDVVDTIFRHSE